MLVVDDAEPVEVFEVIEIADDCVRVRSHLLFEIGEQLQIVVERDDQTFEATARVRAHTGPRDALITELEILERSDSTPR